LNVTALLFWMVPLMWMAFFLLMARLGKTPYNTHAHTHTHTRTHTHKHTHTNTHIHTQVSTNAPFLSSHPRLSALTAASIGTMGLYFYMRCVIGYEICKHTWFV